MEDAKFFLWVVLPLWIGIIVAAWAIVAFSVGRAGAEEHMHLNGEVITGATGKFYEHWMRPDDRTLSCCSRMDCDFVAAVRHLPDGRIMAKRRNDGKWLLIPPQKIETERDSPDAAAHMCSMGDTVYCFIEGSGS